MSNVKKAIAGFIRDEEGTELVEWGLIAGLIIVIAAAVFATIGNNLETIFNALSTNVQTAADNAGGGGTGGTDTGGTATGG